MILVGIIDEDFVNYKKPSMTIEFPYCDLKCDRDCGMPVCQNSNLLKQPMYYISADRLYERYHDNPITNAIVCQGLEPFDSWHNLEELIHCFRVEHNCLDDFVIYTGYNEDEINRKIKYLKCVYPNIIVKFGRFVPNDEPHYDEVLGVKLASSNQYAEKIS